MRKIVFAILIVLSLCLSFCTSTTNRNGQRELIPNPEKYEHDGYSQLPDSLKPVFYPDTVIGDISLLSSKNVSDYLGADVMDRLAGNGIPSTTMTSKDRKQKLNIFFHPGSSKNEFSEFEVKYNNRGNDVFRSIGNTEFISENKIKLGITVGDLKSIKGEPDSVINNSTVTFHYEINVNDSSDFLERYNMPEYYEDYEFKNGYLIRFKFGFVYP